MAGEVSGNQAGQGEGNRLPTGYCRLGLVGGGQLVLDPWACAWWDEPDKALDGEETRVFVVAHGRTWEVTMEALEKLPAALLTINEVG